MKAFTLIFLVILFVLGFSIFWMTTYNVERVISAPGIVKPVEKVRSYRAKASGVISEVKISVGDDVNNGEILISLNNEQITQQIKLLKVQEKKFEDNLARLIIESKISSSIKNNFFEKPLSEVQRLLLEARNSTLQQEVDIKRVQIQKGKNEIDGLKELIIQTTKQIDIINKEYETTLRLAELDLATDVALNELRMKALKLFDRRVELSNRSLLVGDEIKRLEHEVRFAFQKFQEEATSELISSLQRLEEVRAKIKAQRVFLDDYNVRSNVDGVVSKLTAAGENQYVKEGEVMVEVLPANSTFFVEAEIRPQDVAEITIEQPARVILTAYNLQDFGYLSGSVDRISETTSKKENGSMFYKGTIGLQRKDFVESGLQAELKSGMIAEVQILGKNRSFFNYFFEPFLSAELTLFSE